MDTNKLLMIISIIAVGGLFFGFIVTTFTGFAVTDSVQQTTTEGRLALIEKLIGITSGTRQPLVASETMLSRLDRFNLGNCEYLGLADLRAKGIKVSGEKIMLNAKDVCTQLNYKSCFAGEYINTQIYYDSTGTTCTGNTQFIGRDVFMEECNVAPIAEVCKTNPRAGEPYNGDFKDNRYLVAAICCGK